MNGLWTVEFGSNTGMFGGGVAVFRDGQILGMMLIAAQGIEAFQKFDVKHTAYDDRIVQIAQQILGTRTR